MSKIWLRVKDVPEYCGVSVRQVREWFKIGLKHSRIKGIVLIKTSALDEFIELHQIQDNEIERIIGDTMKDL